MHWLRNRRQKLIISVSKVTTSTVTEACSARTSNRTLILLDAFLIVRSTFRMRHFDHLVHNIKLEHSVIVEFID